MGKVLLIVFLSQLMLNCSSKQVAPAEAERSVASAGQLQISPSTESVEVVDGSLTGIYMTPTATAGSNSQKYTWSTQVHVSNRPEFTEVSIGSLPDGLYKIRVGRFGADAGTKTESSAVFAIRRGVIGEMTPDSNGDYKIIKTSQF